MLKLSLFRTIAGAMALIVFAGAFPVAASFDSGRHPVPREHPRLFRSLESLRQLKQERPEAYTRMAGVARKQPGKGHPNMASMALAAAIENDEALGKDAVRFAMEYVNAPIRSGHVTFGADLAYTAMVYDLCWQWWTPEERGKYHEYMNGTVDANMQSETHVFHNAWYGYKHWGYGLACYASWYENPRAEEILRITERDYLERAAPALKMAGNGGNWAEGYYVNYWILEWLIFCETARACEGLDYYAEAPEFYRNRAVAGMFEMFPGIGEYNTRRPVPMGDGGGQVFGGDRDKTLTARRILVNRFRDDPSHRVVHAFNETTPRTGVSVYAWMDFLWRDETVPKGDLKNFRLSHLSPGAGFIFARSSWEEDATYFFFRCGDRFTAHQHLDNGHFIIWKNAELAGDGGHYAEFGPAHDVNYHLRTIAHSTLLVRDPSEAWPNIRAGKVEVNDGGQAHPWPHHNGSVGDPQEWLRGKEMYDIADLLAFEDRGDYLYVAGDCARS
ncbi:MAG: heparinase II/III domain-containing protein, partial [Candidatus Latescibacterota bacterium]